MNGPLRMPTVEPGGSARCCWNRYGRIVTTRLKDLPRGHQSCGLPVGVSWPRAPLDVATT